jgi:hypothetical protein
MTLWGAWTQALSIFLKRLEYMRFYMGQHDTELVESTLTYLLSFDLIKTAISTIGSVNAADKMSVNNAVYDEFTNAASEEPAEEEE